MTGDAGAAGAKGDTGGSGGSSGGSSTGGSGGGGGGTGGGSVGGESCDTDETTPNGDLASAIPYSVGTRHPACLHTADDIDFFEFSAPNVPGYMVVSVIDVGMNSNVDVQVYTLADQGGELVSAYDSSRGGSAYAYFAAYPGAAYAVSVEPWSSTIDGPNPYVLSVAFHEIDDPYEPNNLRSAAKTIEVGEPIEAYMYAGFENSSSIPSEDWYDWYKLALEPGEATILLEVFANDINGEIQLYDPLGVDIAYEYESTNGASVVVEHAIEEAGTYFVRIAPWSSRNPRGTGSNPPQYLTVPYTLTVTQ
jgi:hypothetical protein